MKAQFEDIPRMRGAGSYVVYRYDTTGFPFLWHYHPEYELTLILEGSGKRIVGDSHAYFSPGDLVLLGPNLPHTWVSETSSAAVVIQFTEAFIGGLTQYAECDRIRKVLARSAQGLHFPGKTAVRRAIEKLPGSKGVGRITGLLDVLQALTGGVALASPYFQPAFGKKAEGRINKVFRYIDQHFCEEMPLARVASMIGLSESAFCKFFKRTTGRTFSEYVADIRIGHACQLLNETDDTISGIAWRSGFESLTYFNRVFLKKKGMRPREFRKGGG